MNHLTTIITRAKEYLPSDLYQKYQRLFYTEHIEVLSKTLALFFTQGIPKAFPLPHFKEECTPSYQQAFTPFISFFEKYKETKELSILAEYFAEILSKIDTAYILILLGQRFTSASLTDTRAIPPTQDTFIKTASSIHSAELMVAARAWNKHAARYINNQSFWGEVRGTAAEKNQKALSIIQYILANKTWWNVFGHYCHDIVYEARIAQGYGVRWGMDGHTFIGFLEPFLEE